MIKLIEKGGRLYVANADVYDKSNLFEPGDDVAIIANYGEDCDFIPWPFVEGTYWTMDKIKTAFARALYDSVETGILDWRQRSVLLPDGMAFAIDTATIYCPECDEDLGTPHRPGCVTGGTAPAEPPEPDGEAFRGGEAAAYEAEQMAKIQRELK